MGADDRRLDFRPRTGAPPVDRRATHQLAIGLLLTAAALAAARVWWPPPTLKPALVEIRGEVPRPGLHQVPALTVHAALAAAGAEAEGVPDGPLAFGDRLEVHGGEVRILPPSDPVLVGLPVDLNTANVDALAAIPGLGREQAAAIVAWRGAHGPFVALADVEAVPGIGPATRERLAPFVVQR